VLDGVEAGVGHHLASRREARHRLQDVRQRQRGDEPDPRVRLEPHHLLVTRGRGRQPLLRRRDLRVECLQQI
jgi:hypothetical protein